MRPQSLESRKIDILNWHDDGKSVVWIAEAVRNDGLRTSPSTVWRRIKEWTAEDSGATQGTACISCGGTRQAPDVLLVSPATAHPAPPASVARQPTLPVGSAPVATNIGAYRGPLLGLVAVSVIAVGGFFLSNSSLDRAATGVPIDAAPAKSMELIAKERSRLSVERTLLDAEKRTFEEKRAKLTVTLQPEFALVPVTNEMQFTQHETGNPLIDEMIAASLRNDSAGILALKAQIDALPKLPRGNRQVARQLNFDAIALLLHRRFDQAIVLFQRASGADPGDVEVAENLGYAALKAGHLGDARRDLYQALTLDPARDSAWTNLGVVLAQTESQELAVAAFGNAYRFSNNKQVTVRHFMRLATEELNFNVKAAAAKAYHGFS